MVAIPAVWLFNALSQRITRLLTAVETVGEELAVQALAVRADAGNGERQGPWR
jgi:biopolymer transport protein ExbB/TolQ